MLTFILNVLGEVLGIGNLYCMPFYSVGSGPRARPRSIFGETKRRLRELWTSYSAATRGADSYSTSVRRAQRQL